MMILSKGAKKLKVPRALSSNLPSGILVRAAASGSWIVFGFLRVTNTTVAVILLYIISL